MSPMFLIEQGADDLARLDLPGDVARTGIPPVTAGVVMSLLRDMPVKVSKKGFLF